MVKKIFGDYSKGSTGHVLNSLVHTGVPLTVVENVTIDSQFVLCRGQIIAKFKDFEAIEQTLFRFNIEAYSQQHFIALDGGVRPVFKLLLNANDNPALIVTGSLVSKSLVEFIETTLSTTDKGSDILVAIIKASEPVVLKRPTDADYQSNPTALELHVEFRNPSGAQAFVDYVNSSFFYKRHSDG